MKTSKTVIESIAVAALAMALAITAVTGNGVSTVSNSTVTETQVEKNGIAGVAVAMNEYEQEAADELSETVSVEKVDAELVTATAEETTETTEGTEVENTEKEEASAEVELTEEEKKWQNKLMAKVDNFIYVRAEADADSEIVGKLYKGDRATIKKVGSKWTKITSGNVTGYVRNKNCVTGTEALAYAKKTCDTVAKVTADGVRVRKEQNTDSTVIKTVNTGDKLTVNTKKKTKDGWVAVKVNSKTYYIREKYVTVSLKTGKAVTLAEEEAAKKEAAAKEAAKKEAAAKEAELKKAASSRIYDATEEEEYLLAAIIQCEADGQSKNGMIAVGAVVLNRVKSSSFPNTISNVIYQRGQFGPASSGKLARRLSRGVSSAAKEAAKEALKGTDPTNGAKYFKLASSGHSGVVIGPVVFY